MTSKKFLAPLILGLFFQTNALANIGLDTHYCDESGKCSKYFVAHSFPRAVSLSAKLTRLLESAGINDRRYTAQGTTEYEAWIVEHDDWAAAFFSITLALSKLEITLADGAKITALDLVTRVKSFAGDRIYVELDRAPLENWLKSGGAFKFYRADGQHETGKFKLGAGNLGGSVHDGFDVQGYTSTSKTPRLQINYRNSDSGADIDLDGFPPLIWGFVPNPKHLTYENSDPRQWYDNLVKKVGNPGFKVRPN